MEVYIHHSHSRSCRHGAGSVWCQQRRVRVVKHFGGGGQYVDRYERAHEHGYRIERANDDKRCRRYEHQHLSRFCKRHQQRGGTYWNTRAGRLLGRAETSSPLLASGGEHLCERC